MSVRIRILSRLRNIVIKVENGVFTYNNKVKNVNLNNFLIKLTQIVSFWDDIYINNLIIDGERFEVELEQDGQTAKYVGYGKYPQNYAEFTRLIDEVAKC